MQIEKKTEKTAKKPLAKYKTNIEIISHFTWKKFCPVNFETKATCQQSLDKVA